MAGIGLRPDQYPLNDAAIASPGWHPIKQGGRKMKGKISGLAFHYHHDKLYEWVSDYDKRVEFIKTSKDTDEQPLRLRLFQMIPRNKIPDELWQAGEAYIKAEEATGKAWEAYIKAEEAVYIKAGEASGKAWEAYIKAEEAFIKAGEAKDKAEEAYYKAREAYYIKSEEALHKELCPDCPFDGKTIFTRRDEKGVWY